MDPNAWHDAGLTLDMALDDLLTAKTPVEFSEAVIHVSNARHDLRTFLPGWDHETGTLPWERHVE
jgi:hypothetical protein